MKRILVTGVNGMLGEAVEKVFKKEFHLILTDIEEFDVRIPKQFHKAKPSPDYILHLAAETDLEFCETYPRYAYYTNTIGTFNMVEIARQLDIPIIYMSTAGVFGSESASYFDEDSKPNPVNVYGRSKLYGETAVRAYPKHYIFRLSWAFGGGSRDRKFVMKILKQLTSGTKELWAVDDKSGSPTYTHDVAKLMKKFILEKKPYGLYHVPTGVATRYDVAKEIVSILQVDIEVNKTTSDKFILYTCTRPKCEVLKSIKEVEIRDWKEALKEYIDEFTINKSLPKT